MDMIRLFNDFNEVVAIGTGIGFPPVPYRLEDYNARQYQIVLVLRHQRLKQAA